MVNTSAYINWVISIHTLENNDIVNDQRIVCRNARFWLDNSKRKLWNDSCHHRLIFSGLSMRQLKPYC